MSIINKMLRDLDKRLPAAQSTDPQDAVTLLRQGTSSMPYTTNADETKSASQVSRYMVLALGVVVGCSSPWWWMRSPVGAPQQSAKAPAPAEPARTGDRPPGPVPLAEGAQPPVANTPAVQATTLTTAAANPTPAARAIPVAQATPVAPTTPVVAATAELRQDPTPASDPQRQPDSVLASANFNPNQVTGAPLRPDLVAQPLVLASTDGHSPAARSAGTGTAATTNPTATVTADSGGSGGSGANTQHASRNTLAQAQALWNAGSPDAATDLLQQAVEVAQRIAQGSPGPANAQILAPLARELSRMLLAQGRAAACVDMLAQLEPWLSDVPDIWALRGNAAQRAGRHQESVAAYTAALQLRPNEQRWLLGSAVSLAALGQTAQAAVMADQAASIGPMPKDVQSYLRQLGVALKE